MNATFGTNEKKFVSSFKIEETYSFTTEIKPSSGSQKEPYTGSYIVTPKTEAQEMQTKDKLMTDNVSIKSIPYFSVSNTSGGNTIYIGSEV